MANEKQVAWLKGNVEGWNAWRAQHLSEWIDLRGANLREVDLRGANLSRVTVYETDLHRDLHLHDAIQVVSTLDGAKLNKANLRGADLRGADLRGADLRGADLRGADLRDADLRDANLGGANLRDANLRDATLGATVFTENDLQTVKGLETLTHKGPSIVDIKTVLLPPGDTMTAFLRGTGFPDAFIDYLPSLLEASPIQYFSTFISYAHDDEPFARRLFNDLQNNGVRCWFAPHHMKIGDEIRTRIDSSIHTHDRLLLVLSEHSIRSHWVKHEVETAFEKEQRSQYQVLFPITLDTTIKQTTLAWAATIRRERHIGDFTHWQDNEDAYQRAFQRVLRDLKRDLPLSKQ